MILSLLRKSPPSRKKAEARGFALPPGVRVYAVGDVHGRIDLLEKAFAAIDADLADAPPQSCATIMLGDYIDRGPQSGDVLFSLVARKSSDPTLVCLKGNHEQTLLDILDGKGNFAHWLTYGGRETLMSYGIPTDAQSGQHEEEIMLEFRRALPEAHLAFLRALEPAVACGDYFFVHAGVRPGVPLAEQSERDLLWIREEFIAAKKPFEKRIVHGHTPCKAPEVLPHRINIDTGAYITNRLTCLVLEGTEHRFLGEPS